MSRVVLVTGVSRDLGGRFARALAASSGHTVLGFDAVSPRRDLGPVRFLRGDVRSLSFHGVLTRHGVDTLVHCGLVEGDPTTSPSVVKEHNLLSAMQLAAACQQAPRLRRLIVRSTGQVYGSSPLDPARFAEDLLTLTQVLRILGRPTIGVWHETPGLLGLAQRSRLIRFTADDVRGVTWGRLLDTRRIAAAGFTPHYSSRRAVEEFAALGEPGWLSADRVEDILDGMARILSPRSHSPRSEAPRHD